MKTARKADQADRRAHLARRAALIEQRWKDCNMETSSDDTEFCPGAWAELECPYCKVGDRMGDVIR